MTGSVEVWLTLVPSLLWLLYRLFALLKSPVELLVENLDIEIPHVPQICIDAVTGLLVVVHWDIEVSEDEELIYVVLVNNREAAMVNTTSCKLNQLMLNKVYQIEVLAVNVATNFRSRSAPVYIETLLRELVASELAQLPFRSLSEPQMLKTDETGLESCVTSSVSSELQFIDNTADVVHTSEPLMISSLKKPVQPPPVLTTDQIKAIENPADLNFYLLMYQAELQKLLSEREAFQYSVKSELDQLRQVAKEHKRKYNEESDMKVRLDNNIKDIEKKRDQLSFTKGKLQTQLKQIKSTSHLHESKLDSLKKEYEKYQQKATTSHEKAKQEALDLKAFQQRLKITTQEHRILNDQLESDIKFLTNEKKKNEKLLNTVKPLMEMFGSESNFTREGTLKSNSQTAMNTVFDTMPEWKEEILEELDKTRLTELEWRLVFKTEIRKYLTVKNNLEMTKAARIKGYTPQKTNEYQASLEFGGYNHALSKLGGSNIGGFKSKLSKFSIIGKGHHQNQTMQSSQGHADYSNQHGNNDFSNQQQNYIDYSNQQQNYGEYSNQSQNFNEYSPSGNMDATQDSKSVEAAVADSLELTTPLGPSVSGLSGTGSDANTNSWNNYFGHVYSNDNSFDKSTLNNESMVPEVPLVSEPNVLSNDSAVGMNLQQLFLGEQYYNTYSQTLPPNLWQSSQQSTSNYVPLNGLAYKKDQFYGTPTNSSGNVAGNLGLPVAGGTYSAPNGSSGNQGPFGELFPSSLNQSGTSFQSATPGPMGNEVGSLRSQVLLQKLDMALLQLYMTYNPINSSHQGLDGFLGTSQPGTSFLDSLPNNGSGILQLPNSSQPELSDTLQQYSKSLSPQLGSLLLNKSNLWGNSPFSGHSRNLLSNSQIWRNESSEQPGSGELNFLKNERSDLNRESRESE